MKVSLSWLGVLILVLVIFTFTYKGFCILYESQFESLTEGFVSTSKDTQGIHLITCPSVPDGMFPELDKEVDSNGNTICKNTQTNAPTCTLSEGVGNLPTCNEYLLAHFRSRAETMCPPSLPNYHESKDSKGNRVRGCFTGSYNITGTGPLSTSSRSCRVYDDKKRDELAFDSCTNIKMLDTVQCIPGTVAKKSLRAGWNQNIPPAVWCEYNNPITGMPALCAEDSSTWKQHMAAVREGIIPSNWTETYPSYHKINWCQKQKMVEIDKSISYDDLQYVSIEPNATGPVYPPFDLQRVKNSRLRNKASKLCWDIWGAGKQNGAGLVTWDCHGGGNQKFTYDAKERLVAAHSGKCIDLDGGTLRVQQWDCHDGPNQKWYHDSQGRIRSRANNLCLKTVGSKGIQATVAFCGDGEDQKFENV